MYTHYFFSSLTRIADLNSHPFTVDHLPRDRWSTGDYVVGEVIAPLPKFAKVELINGRLASLLEGDVMVGAFGVRRATLEAVGDWQSIGAKGYMHDMTLGGLFGQVTSQSFLLSPMTSLIYRGHVMRRGHKLGMSDFVPELPMQPLNCPTVMIIGTSMSAGKTTTARIIIHQLKQLGLKVIGAKLTGAGRYRDILAMQDAGADRIFDFVDVGLPSSVGPPEAFRVSVKKLLSMIAAETPDVLVAEAGASPYEPYNGAVVLEEMQAQVRCTVLCASDPYAVLGVSQSFGLTPDIISGVAASTTSGVELVEKLTGVPTLQLPNCESLPKLMEILKVRLEL